MVFFFPLYFGFWGRKEAVCLFVSDHKWWVFSTHFWNIYLQHKTFMYKSVPTVNSLLFHKTHIYSTDPAAVWFSGERFSQRCQRRMSHSTVEYTSRKQHRSFALFTQNQKLRRVVGNNKQKWKCFKKWQELWLSNISLQAWHQIQKRTMYKQGAGCVRRRAARTRKWTQRKKQRFGFGIPKKSPRKQGRWVTVRQSSPSRKINPSVIRTHAHVWWLELCHYALYIYTNFTSRRELCTFSHRCADQLVPVAGHWIKTWWSCCIPILYSDWLTGLNYVTGPLSLSLVETWCHRVP